MSMTGELFGKTVLITGASRGIGQAVATAAAAAGATTLLCARDVPALERLADTIEASGAPAPVLAPLNLETATLGDYEELAALIAARFRRLDGMVFNAAAVGELAPLATYDPLTWARVFQVNVHSVFLMLQALLPVVLSAKQASLVFTLAPEGIRGKANWGAYGASKFALRGLFEMLAAEHANNRGLRVNAVVPPPVRSRLRFAAYPGENPAHLAEPEQVAHRFIELLAPDGVSGDIVPLGASMRGV